MTTPALVSQYDKNALVRLVATIVGSDLVTPTDPSVFMFLVGAPTLAATPVACFQFGIALASITKAGVGAYYKDITVDTVGPWYYRSHATGLVQAAEEWQFQVVLSHIV